jgi:hypothetical protein
MTIPTQTPDYNIEIERGCVYSVTFNYNDPITDLPIDVSAYTATMNIRQNYYSTYGQPPDLSISNTPSTNGSGLVLGDGAIQLVLVSADTESLTFTNGVYDITLTNDGLTTKFLRGLFTILPTA